MINIAEKCYPGNFKEFIQTNGNADIVKNILFGGMANVFIFTGSGGTGKTSLAYLTGRAFLCNNYKNWTSVNDVSHCGVCSSCATLLPYLVNLELIKNNYTDLFNCINETIHKEDKVVVVLENIDRVPLNDQNYFVHFIKNKPDKCLVIFCCEDFSAVCKDLSHCCTVVNFTSLPSDLMLKRLQVICKTHKIPYDDDGLKFIVDISGGNFRVALNYLTTSNVTSISLPVNDVRLGMNKFIDNLLLGVFCNELYDELLSKITVAGFLSLLLNILKDKSTVNKKYKNLLKLVVYVPDEIKLDPTKFRYYLCSLNGEITGNHMLFAVPKQQVFISDDQEIKDGPEFYERLNYNLNKLNSGVRIRWRSKDEKQS